MTERIEDLKAEISDLEILRSNYFSNWLSASELTGKCIGRMKTTASMLEELLAQDILGPKAKQRLENLVKFLRWEK